MALRVDYTRLLQYAIMAGTVMCAGCQSRTPDMKVVPPEEALFGKWVIDRERTTWEDLENVWESQVVKPEDGYLELSPDGHFVIEAMPDVSSEVRFSDIQHRNGEGTWSIRCPAYHPPYIWLKCSEMDGHRIQGHEMAFWFIEEDNEYYLRASIDAEFDFLVLRRIEAAKPDSANQSRNGGPRRWSF